jgi:hypothetical protein
MADIGSTLLADRSWFGVSDSYEQILQKLAQQLQAAGLTPGTPEYESQFVSIVNGISLSTNTAMTDPKYSDPTTGNNALANWMGQNLTQEQATALGLDVTSLRSPNGNLSVDAMGSYSNITHEFIPPDDVWQRDQNGEKVLDENGQPINRYVYGINQFYMGLYGRMPTDAEVQSGLTMYGDYTAGTKYASSGSSSGISGAGTSTTGDSSVTGITAGGVTTNLQILKAALRGLGFTSTILDSSTSFLTSLLKEGLDYDNATEIFLNNKDYTLKNGTKINSPFYTEYGYLNEGLTVPKSANELFNTVEGYKSVVSKYNLSSKYLTQDSLQKYIKNDITVNDLANRAATAQLRAVEADPFQVDALIKQGYISSASNLTDFYMDPSIGQQQLELNKQTGVFTAEALRRAGAGVLSTQAQLDAYKKLTASLAAKGYSEGEIARFAGIGFENIAQELNPTVKLSQIYEKAGGTVASNAALAEGIQTNLMAEEFQGTASERRKKLIGMESAAFQGSSGMYSRYGVSKSLAGPAAAGQF